MSTALIVKKRIVQKTSEFFVKKDPFYSQSNLEYLEKVTSEIDSGVAKLEEHELIEI